MSLADLVHGMTTRYLVVDNRVYRLESVDSAALLRAGFPHLEGVSVVASAKEEEVALGAGDDVLAVGGTEEQAEVKRKAMREELAAAARHRTAQQLATAEGQQRYVKAIIAYALASVSGIGPAPVPLERQDPGEPAIELLPPDVIFDGIHDARLIDEPRSEAEPRKQAAELAARNLVPLWAIEPKVIAQIGATAAMLAAGRAATAAPFRGGIRTAVRD